MECQGGVAVRNSRCGARCPKSFASAGAAISFIVPIQAMHTVESGSGQAASAVFAARHHSMTSGIGTVMAPRQDNTSVQIGRIVGSASPAWRSSMWRKTKALALAEGNESVVLSEQRGDAARDTSSAPAREAETDLMLTGVANPGRGCQPGVGGRSGGSPSALMHEEGSGNGRATPVLPIPHLEGASGLEQITGSAGGKTMALPPVLAQLAAGSSEGLTMLDADASLLVGGVADLLWMKHTTMRPDAFRYQRLVGVVVKLLGTSLITAALLGQQSGAKGSAQSLSPRLHASSSNNLKESIFERWHWHPQRRVSWIVAAVLGSLVCWAGQELAPGSLISALSCWSIAFTMILHAIAVQCCGADSFLEATVLGDGNSPATVQLPPPALPSPEKLLGAGLTLMGTVVITIEGEGQHMFSISSECRKTPPAICIGVSFALLLVVAVHLIYKDPLPGFPHASIYLTFAWCTCILSKAAAAVLTTLTWCSGLNPLMSFFWIGAVALLVAAVCQVGFLVASLRRADAIVVVPTYMSISAVGRIVINRFVFWGELPIGFKTHARFWPGVICAIVGAMVLGGVQAREDQAEAIAHIKESARRRGASGGNGTARSS